MEARPSTLISFGISLELVMHLNNFYFFLSCEKWISPYINRFIQADTVIPDLSNPQGWNRFAYTLNNPINYSDPTGHSVACNPYEDDCHHNSAPTNPAPATGNNGNTGGGNSGCQADPNCDLSGGTGAGGLKKPKDEGSGACGAGGMVDCPPTVGLTYRDTITYHLLDSNVVYQTPIYDYSYYPQKLIGYQMKYYTRDEFHFSLKNLLLPSDPIMWASTIQTVGSELLKIGSSNLGKLAGFISPVCPECVATLSVVAGVDSVNNAITFDGHIVTQVYYFNQSPFETPYQTPFDPKKIP